MGKQVERLHVGRNKRGTPRRGLADYVKEDMKEREISESGAWKRSEWRKKSAPAIPIKLGLEPEDEEESAKL